MRAFLSRTLSLKEIALPSEASLSCLSCLILTAYKSAGRLNNCNSHLCQGNRFLGFAGILAIWMPRYYLGSFPSFRTERPIRIIGPNQSPPGQPRRKSETAHQKSVKRWRPRRLSTNARDPRKEEEKQT